eukprot:gene14542-17188_t
MGTERSSDIPASHFRRQIVYNSQTPSGASNPVYGWIGSALCGALAIFLLALVPVLQAAREALLELAALIATVREEVPDTAAAIRLPALEVTDTLEDLGTLGEFVMVARISSNVVAELGC